MNTDPSGAPGGACPADADPTDPHHSDHGLGLGVVGHGFATIARDGTVLDARFVRIVPAMVAATETSFPAVHVLSSLLDRRVDGLVRADERRDVRVVPISTRIADVTAPIADRFDTFLRLYLLSSRRLAPGQTSLAGVLDRLVDVAWTSIGPCLPARVEEAQWLGLGEGVAVTVAGVWPFPRMTDYVVPDGVRIMTADNVRLGAYLARGTNVLGGGYCNTGSATLGRCAIEGRLSLGVQVGEGSHIGGGASLMGTTSGGGRQHVSVGRNCLVGANAGLGITIGDGCIVEAGCFVTPGSLVTLADGRIVKAAALSGQPNLMFRRRSDTGRIEALPAPGWGGLNPKLHH